MLNAMFFARPAAEVARDLIGRTLVVADRAADRFLRVVITTVAAHEGGKPTTARRGMIYIPGTIFIMRYRGLLFLNIATGAEGEASCVFIRGGIVVGSTNEVLDGPAKLTKRLGVGQALDGKPLGDEMRIEGEGVNPALVEESRPEATADNNCVGIFLLR